MSSETPQPQLTGSAMEEPPVIEVRNLVKEYRLGALEGVKTLAKRLLGQPVPPRQRFRALNDVSFSIRRGEVVGIIGHNGAGKSTLLKMLCNITTPTSGSVKVRGRVAPLIEVGAGLIGDMTGRENIYLNASILGLTRAEIEHRVDEIIDFAELKEFIDTPIKRYSSGMQVRLGFAIAVYAETQILIIDEVLAVGDVSFQRKCFDRIMALLQSRERTVVIVGHNIRQIQRIATRMLLLDGGELTADGNCRAVSAKYFEQMDAKHRLEDTQLAGKIVSTGEIVLRSVSLLNAQKAPQQGFAIGESIMVAIDFSVRSPVRDIEVAVGLVTSDQVPICMQSSGRDKLLSLDEGNHKIFVTFRNPPILPGDFFVRVHFQDTLGTNLIVAEDVQGFRIHSGTRNRADLSSTSLIEIPTEWEHHALASTT